MGLGFTIYSVTLVFLSLMAVSWLFRFCCCASVVSTRRSSIRSSLSSYDAIAVPFTETLLHINTDAKAYYEDCCHYYNMFVMRIVVYHHDYSADACAEDPATYALPCLGCRPLGWCVGRQGFEGLGFQPRLLPHSFAQLLPHF